MSNALARGNFVVSVELVPPRGYRAESLVEQARHLRIHGVDLVNIPDGPRATGRMSALAAAVMVQQQAGVETILHYACRDRNMIGMQSDLLGAHAMDVRNLLLVTGDPPRVGDYPDATAVFEVDSIGLDESGRAAEPRARHRRAGHRPGDGVSHRRGGQPGRVRSRPGDPPLRVQGRGGRRVRDHAAGVRRGGDAASSSSGSSASGFRCSRGSCRSRACATPSSWPTKCRASACRTSYWIACGAPRTPAGRARRAGDRARARGRAGRPGPGPAGYGGLGGGRRGPAGARGDPRCDGRLRARSCVSLSSCRACANGL